MNYRLHDLPREQFGNSAFLSPSFLSFPSRETYIVHQQLCSPTSPCDRAGKPRDMIWDFVREVPSRETYIEHQNLCSPNLFL